MIRAHAAPVRYRQNDAQGHHWMSSASISELAQEMAKCIQLFALLLRPGAPIIALHDEHRASECGLAPSGNKYSTMKPREAEDDQRPAEGNSRRYEHSVASAPLG